MSAVTAQGARRAASHRATATRVPRRVSGPATGRVRARPAPQHPTVGARTLAVVRSLPDHSLIDRLVRGRAWIPVLGVLLAGIVATQVEILKLGTSLGRSLDRTASLQSQNEALQAGIASLQNAQRVEQLAAGMGMVMPSPELLTFVPAGQRNQLGKAIANIQAPDPTDFASQLEAQIQSDELSAPASTTATSSQTSSSAPGTGGAAAGQTAADAPGTTATAEGTAATAPAAPTTSTTPVSTVPADTGPSQTTPTGAAGLPAASTSQPGISTGG